MRISVACVPLFLLVAFCRASAVVYHVDSQSGNDAASGVSPETAWKSLERVNRQMFVPGDQVLFKSGTRYAGQLKPQGSGAVVDCRLKPITIGRYGPGAKPRLDAEGRHLDAVLLRNVEFWELEDLEITNSGAEREPWRTGVRILSESFGRMRHIHLRNLFVHDVNGDLRKSQEGCGIYFEDRGGNASHFEDLLIEGCHVVRTDRNGICQRTGGRSRSLGVVIRGNLLEDIGGDGIKVWGSNGALIERNVLRGGRTRCEDYAAGVWPFDCDDTVIQFNEVSGMKGTKDGQAFDSDYRCRRSLFQYNYSHDNDGGFMLICTPGNSYNEDTVIRYNISQNDGINQGRVFHFGGGPKNTLIYNNTVYLGKQQALPLVLCTDWNGGQAEGTRFFNNIFYVAGKATYDLAKSRENVFEHNLFCGGHRNPPADPQGATNCPSWANWGSGRDGFASLAGYQWPSSAPKITGRLIPNNGGRDFFGRAVAVGAAPCVGASEAP